ncbi:plant cysteine oxidase 2-like isoform X2 [Aristolochia californica]|uniref:plant cysteine oxidase 2-like isoform X2 n=1 Tax=Aristolochia californica TaxID=171875 RepID=UPI0035DAFE14
MKTEASLVVNKGEVLREGNGIIRKKCHRRTKRIPYLVPSRVQRLFTTCKDVFKGPGTVPSPRDVEKLKLLLDNMKPEDVGLSRDLLFFTGKDSVEGTPAILCTTIYKCDNFSLCIFFLPPTAVIPLHNHPDMTVFNKLLVGTMHIKSYDWVGPVETDGSKQTLRLAKLEQDSVFTAPRTSVLYPSSGGNIHAFTAITACAVLDVMGPPYSIKNDRDCNYYKEFAFSNVTDGAAGLEDDSSYGWLQEIDMPKDLKMDVVEYLGPQIIGSE